MNIDLTSLITTNNTIEIDSDVTIPTDLFEKTNIRRLENIHVNGIIKKLFEEYNFIGTITGQMILPDDLTLEDVTISLNIKFDEMFTENDLDNENNLIIINNRLDIIPFLWQNIVLEVPLKVIGEKNKNIKLEGNGWRLITEEELNTSNNSPFSNLQEMIDSRKE
jgi:uncharacterized protein